ncbi:MAG TPA: hypothetical protein VFZ09_11320 [Archangium sp.]|uniref:hypothetical protein n=1 Tax=Archangium sp. TaxID=1872627 RepID=UPI002E3300D9|nr:hypothetical protein [Archangium sp.]HEX5746824.1 hypothetical protein [Archangium sp.]
MPASAKVLTSDAPRLGAQLQEEGYVYLPAIFEPSFLRALERECDEMAARYYRVENLDRHAVYLSDNTPTRISHAMMISAGPSPLPTVPLEGLKSVEHFLRFHDEVLGALLGADVPAWSRSMLNWQTYSSGSKPVTEHFDGEYLDYRKNEDGGFTLHEGLLPRLVLILTLSNENDGELQGTVLRDTRTGREVSPPSRSGDVLVFDNVRMRHRVPTLERPRRMAGLRSFDFRAVHFALDEASCRPGASYRRMPEGLVSEEVDAVAVHQQFLRERWPQVREAQRTEGALF